MSNDSVMSSRAFKYYRTYRTLPDAIKPFRPTSGPYTKTNIGNPGAPHISQVGAQTLTAQVGLADEQTRKFLKELLVRKARNAETELQGIVRTRYQGGTGRLGRGIRVTAKVTDTETGIMGKLSLSLPRYRETPYVTNIGNQGIFHKLGGGVPPYMIAAKGALKMLTSRSSMRASPLSIDVTDTYLKGSRRRQERMINDPVKGGKVRSYRRIEKQLVRYAKRFKQADFVPRLKIPRGGYTTGIRFGGIFTLLQDLDFEDRAAISVNRRRTRESTVARGGRRGDIPGITRPEGRYDRSGNFRSGKSDVAFRYPIFVVHPGFPPDVISEYWQGTIMSVMNEMANMQVIWTDAVNRGGKSIGVIPPAPLVRDTEAWLRSLSPTPKLKYTPFNSTIPMGVGTPDDTLPY
jgi:hypothetical protein